MYELVYTRTFEIRKGLIYGPFIQVYGMGALAYYFLVKTDQDPKRIFFKGMLLGGALEYLCSFFQEIFFGSVSWDYSNLFLNLNGRTCIQYCFYWGLIGVFFLKAVYPAFEKVPKYLENRHVSLISYIFMVFIIFDVTISCMATNRQNERKKGIQPEGVVDEFLDKTYPDERLNKIFNNRHDV